MDDLMLRAFLLLTGSLLFLLGSWRIVWEFWSWAVLGNAGERPLLLGNDPRIKDFGYCIVLSAIGLSIILLTLFR